MRALVFGGNNVAQLLGRFHAETSYGAAEMKACFETEPSLGTIYNRMGIEKNIYTAK